MSGLRFSTFAATALLSPGLLFSDAFGQEHGASDAGNTELILLIINFVVFLLVMAVVYRKKVQPMMAARSAAIEKELNRAAAELEREERDLTTLRDALESIDDEEEATIAAFREEGVRSAEAIRRQALDDVQLMEKDAEQLKANLFHQLRAEIRQEMSQLALSKAEERLKQNFTNEMDRNLRRDVVQKFLQ